MAATTEPEDDLVDPKKTVRTFSWKAYADDPDDDLAKSLVIAEASAETEEKQEKTSKEQWMQMFDPTVSRALRGQDEIILADPTDELLQAYRKFLKCLPKGHEARIEDGPPKLTAIVEALTLADDNWKSNREKTKAGRMRTLFSKVAVNLYKYKELFAMVPRSDRYLSLVAGSMSAIVKATVNHDKIAESVSNALDDMSDDIAYWKELLEINEHSIRTEHYISRMYVVVFKFLATIMAKWTSRSSIVRLFRSFDSEFFKAEIEDKKAKIRDLNDRLRRQSDLTIQRNTNNIIPKADMIRLIVEAQRDAQAKFEAELLIRLKQQELRLGQTVKGTLEEQYRSHRKEQRGNGPRIQLSTTTAEMISSPTPEASAKFYSNIHIQFDALSQLRSYATQTNILDVLVAQAQPLNVNSEIFSRIQQWNAASTSQALWIQGPFQAPQPSHYTLLSSSIITTAQKVDAPVLYYFCDSTTSMIDLVYSFIAQLVKALPSDFQSDKDFSAARFDALDKTSGSVGKAIKLFKDLLEVGPYMLFLVIDGLQMLENSTNIAQIQALVQALRFAGKNHLEQTRITKTLFTTDGFTDALIQLRGDERMSAEDFAGDDGAGPEVDGIEAGFL